LRQYVKEIVNREDFPMALQRLALTDAYNYTATYLAGEKGKLGICLVCGRWFVASRPNTRVCSKRCRFYLSHLTYLMRRGKRLKITQKLRRTPFYFFFYLAVREGILSPRLLNRQSPEELPSPIPPTTDFFEVLGVSASQIIRRLTEATKEALANEDKVGEGDG